MNYFNKTVMAVVGFILLFNAQSAFANFDVTLDGYGPVKFGMKISEAEKLLGTKLVGGNTDPKAASATAAEVADAAVGCAYFFPKKGYKGLSFMTSDSIIVRVDINSGSIKLKSGIGINSPEKKLLKLYKNLSVEPDKYGDGKNITLYSEDGKQGVRFNTDNKFVTSFYSGLKDKIELVERCG